MKMLHVCAVLLNIMLTLRAETQCTLTRLFIQRDPWWPPQRLWRQQRGPEPCKFFASALPPHQQPAAWHPSRAVFLYVFHSFVFSAQSLSRQS
jgi:hypothetical protein